MNDHEKIAKLAEGIPRRVPVIDNDQLPEYDRRLIDKQWRLITESVRRRLLSDSKIRDLVLEFSNVEVSEDLPKKLLDRLSSDEVISSLRERFSSQLQSYLNLDPVEDDLIRPDIRYAPRLQTPEEIVGRLLLFFDENDPKFQSALKKYIDNETFHNGITEAERVIIAQRYRFARDVKMLALMAEMYSCQELISTSEDQITLPSGIQIHCEIDDPIKKQEILNPVFWNNRKQFKDRVYKISVGTKEFFLKEKKTARHTDTRSDKYRFFPGATSFEEFGIARHFQDNCILEKGMIKLNWETPLAAVTFPDGYQFAIYEIEAGLLPESQEFVTLVNEMLSRPEQFESEFEQVSANFRKYLDHPLVQKYESSSFLSKALSLFGFNKSKVEFTYKDFVLVKADRLLIQAKRLLEEVVLRNGYTNSDSDGFAYKVNILDDGRLQLEIFGFDFECYEPRDNSNLESDLIARKEMNDKDDLSFARVWNRPTFMPDVPVEKPHRAIYLAHLELEGVDVNQNLDEQ